jgi:hypothetical protein
VREVEVTDYIALTVPEDVDPLTLLDGLNRRLEWMILQQYKGKAPHALLIDPVDWIYASTIEEVEAHQPAHDCEECRRGNERAREFLAGHPGRQVILGNVHYHEIWR